MKISKDELKSNHGRPMVSSGHFKDGNIGGVIEEKTVKGWFLGYSSEFRMASFEGEDKKHYITHVTRVEFTE
jgi:hypothetical protein